MNSIEYYKARLETLQIRLAMFEPGSYHYERFASEVERTKDQIDRLERKISRTDNNMSYATYYNLKSRGQVAGKKSVTFDKATQKFTVNKYGMIDHEWANEEPIYVEPPKRPHNFELGDIVVSSGGREHELYIKVTRLFHSGDGYPYFDGEYVFTPKTSKEYKRRFRNEKIQSEAASRYVKVDPSQHKNIFSNHPYTKIFY